MSGYWRLARPAARPFIGMTVAFLSLISDSRSYVFDSDDWAVRVAPLHDDERQAGEVLGQITVAAMLWPLTAAYFVAGVQVTRDAAGVDVVFLVGMLLAVLSLAVVQNVSALSLDGEAG